MMKIGPEHVAAEALRMSAQLSLNIVRLRQEKRWTLAQVAAKAGLRPRQLQLLEANCGRADLYALSGLAGAFDVDPGDLLRPSGLHD